MPSNLASNGVIFHYANKSVIYPLAVAVTDVQRLSEEAARTEGTTTPAGADIFDRVVGLAVDPEAFGDAEASHQQVKPCVDCIWTRFRTLSMTTLPSTVSLVSVYLYLSINQSIVPSSYSIFAALLIVKYFEIVAAAAEREVAFGATRTRAQRVEWLGHG